MSDSSYTVSNVSHPAMDDEIDLKELFAVLWSGNGHHRHHWSRSSCVGRDCPDTSQYIHGKCVAGAAEQSGGGMSALMQQYGGHEFECHSQVARTDHVLNLGCSS